MVAKNILLTVTPYAVERTIKKLGNNLRTARLRRKLTIADVAQKIGTGARAIRAAENGNASTGIAVYAALLWTYGMLLPLAELADPREDEEGLALAEVGPNARARKSRGLDNDF